LQQRPGPPAAALHHQRDHPPTWISDVPALKILAPYNEPILHGRHDRNG